MSDVTTAQNHFAAESWAQRRSIAERLGCDVLDLMISDYGSAYRLDGQVVARKEKDGWVVLMEGRIERA
jgi:hypothetical protein